MTSVATRKCVQHPLREAVARCSACNEHFCRECVVEHDGVLLCAACLARATAPAKPARVSWVRVRELGVTAASLVVAWVTFYGLGSLLKAIPAQIHDGTIWQHLPLP